MNQNQASHKNTNEPFSLEAEQSVLGAIIIDPACITLVLEYLTPESFFSLQNRQIFEVMVQMFAGGSAIDFITLLDNVEQKKILADEFAAKVYLTRLAETVPTSSNVEYYAKIVREKYYLRKILLVAKDITKEAQTGGLDARTLLDKTEQNIFEIRQGRDISGVLKISEVIIELYDHLQRISSEDREDYLGLKTGFSYLDHILTGLNKSDLILVAGRPGMGKTALGLNIAQNVSEKTDKSVVIFSLEMSSQQLVSRILSTKSSIPSNKFRTGDLSPKEWERLAVDAQLVSKKNLYLDDTSNITVPEMKAKLRRVDNLGLVIIDYLQLMSSATVTNNRVQEISEITRSLKIMARELNVPVVLCSQLSRGPEMRTDKRPMLADLRESGSIEQDADIVLMLYRDGYYNADSEESNIAECIISKNRHGETATVKLHWEGQFTRFSNLEGIRSDDPGF